MTKGAREKILFEIHDERCRQIVKEGWTTGHDDAHHDSGDLARAAAAYAWHASATERVRRTRADDPPPSWPWDVKWWKPKSRRRDLIRAAALIVAEIERLDREGTP